MDKTRAFFNPARFQINTPISIRKLAQDEISILKEVCHAQRPPLQARGINAELRIRHFPSAWTGGSTAIDPIHYALPLTPPHRYTPNLPSLSLCESLGLQPRHLLQEAFVKCALCWRCLPGRCSRWECMGVWEEGEGDLRKKWHKHDPCFHGGFWVSHSSFHFPAPKKPCCLTQVSVMVQSS